MILGESCYHRIWWAIFYFHCSLQRCLSISWSHYNQRFQLIIILKGQLMQNNSPKNGFFVFFLKSWNFLAISLLDLFLKDVHFFMIHINNKITWSQVVIKALKTLQRFQNHPPTVSAAGINEAKICQDTKVVQTCLYGYWKSLRQNNMQNVKQPRASLQNYLYWDLHCF